ncbi:hypothetical protein N0V83_010274 [Neocucurbitaria cava]|uniref:Uncharacterized protein n=1 Tax=Neocucurbitaria cava TaxID=798079 RepID=A0A9W8Y144_9PLEO|nr:hypothetical protein N0V83_010274 [Neocucurbitaria cava]
MIQGAMVLSHGKKKFYLKAPDLEFGLDGPIQIGNIIKDMKTPQDPIAALDPTPNIVSGPDYDKGNKTHESHASLGLKFSVEIFQVFGGQAGAKASSASQTVYEFDGIESLYLQTNPTAADAKKLHESNHAVKGALNRGPVFIVTGLKVAKGLRYSNRHVAEKQAMIGRQDHVMKEFADEGTLEGDKGSEDAEEYTVKGDVILAYRLHVIKKEGFRWIGEREIDAKTFDPGEAGFMNHDRMGKEDQVGVGEVSLQDVQYFVEDHEYGGLQVVAVEVEGQSWSMLSIEM